jgi:magnesium chelatase subunit D
VTAVLPFSGLVGVAAAHDALRILAVDPRLAGVAIGAPVGSGKSTLARSSTVLFGKATPFVELPLGCDEDALLGGIDIEATMRTGQRVARPGLLGRANGGVLYVDALNLVPDAVINVLLGAMDTGVVQLEREGMSQRIASRLCVIGTYDPAEGLPRRHLLDRMGLLVLLPRESDVAERHEVLLRHQQRDMRQWHEMSALEAGVIAEARQVLPQVTITREQQQQLVDLALRAGAEGQRVDLFAVATACAAAALDLRMTVNHEDLDLAARLVILPRATRDIVDAAPPPPPPDQTPPPPPQQQPPPPSDEPNQQASPPPDANHDGDDGDSQAPTLQSEEMAIPEDEVLTALTTELPLSLNDLPFRSVRKGRAGSRGMVEGTRGRHIRSNSGDPRRARIDVSATLRAAAPWQPMRKQTQQFDRIALRADDVRVKRYKSKAGVLFCFVVDASGSMALNRMRQAKGAVQHLLQQAYVHRDRVALLAFRGSECEMLLPPSQSVELARRSLDVLPTGGTTPLAAALLGTIEVARQARTRGIMQCVALFLTDGRGNAPYQRGVDIAEEIAILANAVANEGVKSVVIDTQRNYLSRGEGRKLAGQLRGEYIYLPQANGGEIANVAVSLTQ